MSHWLSSVRAPSSACQRKNAREGEEVFNSWLRAPDSGSDQPSCGLGAAVVETYSGRDNYGQGHCKQENSGFVRHVLHLNWAKYFGACWYMYLQSASQTCR